MDNPFDDIDVNTYSTSKPLEWDEAALDSQTSVEGFHDSQRTTPFLGWIKIFMVISCIVLVSKLFSLQVTQGQSFGALADGNRLRSRTILAPRGVITGSDGVILAQNTASFSLVAIPVDLPKQGLTELVDKLVTTFKLDKPEIEEKLSKVNYSSLDPVVLKQDLTSEDSILFETQSSDYPGFAIASIPVRQYPNAESFSHLLGYTTLISDTQLTKLSSEHYGATDFIGAYGLEASYEKYLRGVNGQEQVEVDAHGRPIKVLGTIEPQPGNSLQLNIDSQLQQELYKAFTKNSSRVKGAAIVMNPKTGQVLALLSLPGFDNNLFAHGITSTNYNQLLNDKNLPLFNRAISGTYPPGSTVKPMVALAALETGTITERTVIQDRGVLVIPNQFNPSQTYNFYGWKRDGLGAMDVRSAIAESSDIFFYTVAGGHPASSVQGLGAERLADYYRKFNVGNTSDIDLQGEKRGIVADPAWKADYFKNDKILGKWYLGDTYHIGIGQGDMLVTPLQVAMWTSIIANNGVGYKPEIVNSITDSNGKIVEKIQPKVLIEKFASDKNIKIVQEGMRQTILAGSGRQLATLPITSAGKTGTSQFDGADPSRTHAWFTSYAPFEDPEIVVTVLVEAGGEGHAAAVPIAKQVLQWWAENRYGK